MQEFRDVYPRSVIVVSVLTAIMALHSRCVPFVIAKEPAEQQEITKLIATLASTNVAPKILLKKVGSQDEKVEAPANYDQRAQDRVFRARDKLAGLGIRAFPLLIEQFDDERYSMTLGSSLAAEIWGNHSVGRVCKELVRAQIETYGPWTAGGGDPRSRPTRPSYFYKYLADKDAAQAWWLSHKDKSTLEIQIEALEWAISEEKASQNPKFNSDIVELSSQLKQLREKQQPNKAKVHSGLTRYGNVLE